MGPGAQILAILCAVVRYITLCADTLKDLLSLTDVHLVCEHWLVYVAGMELQGLPGGLCILPLGMIPCKHGGLGIRNARSLTKG